MKLYVCHGTFMRTPRPGGHPCGNANAALREAGHDPEVIKAGGWAVLPSIFNRSAGRQRVKELTGNISVPTLELDDGTVVDGSQAIVQWARANPAAKATAA